MTCPAASVAFCTILNFLQHVRLLKALGCSNFGGMQLMSTAVDLLAIDSDEIFYVLEIYGRVTCHILIVFSSE